MTPTRRAVLVWSSLLLAGGWFAVDQMGLGDGLFGAGDGNLPVAAESTDPAASPGSKNLKSASLNPLGSISLDLLKQTVERPLFNASRVPKPKPEPEIEVAVAAEPEAGPQDFTLIAVVLANNEKTALLRLNKTSEVLRLKAGQTFSEWTLSDVQPKSVVIEKDELSFALKLFEQPSQPAAAGVQDEDDEDEEQDPQLQMQQQQEEAVSRLNNG